MKRFIATIAAVALASSMMFAQDLASVTELYNNAAAALSSGENENALKGFNDALAQAEALGEEGLEIAGNCKGIIPKIILSLAKDSVKASNFDAALAKLAEAKESATKFESADVLDEVATLVPQVLMTKGNSLLTAKDYTAAADVYKQLVADDATNGVAALRLGQALNAAGDVDGAVAAFEQAAANGQDKNANKQIANINLKKAAAALKDKKYADAVAAAVKTTEIDPTNAQAFQIAAQASQLGNKTNDAIKYFEKYLEVAPDAKNAGQIAYTVGALYQQAKNNAKAKEFYQKASTDPKYGAEAKKLLDALK